jgi:hypothetical protein
LSAEIRNQIYEYHLAKKPALKTAVAFYTTSRVVRTKYMPLYFRQNTIPHQFWEFNRFIDTFMGDSCASIASNRICDLEVSIDRSTHPRVYLHSPIIDLKKLVENLISYPEIRISFRGNESYNWEARSLDEFVEAMRSKSISAWRAQTKDFESIELHTNTSWHRGQTDSYTGYFTRRPILEVYAVLTTEAADAMPKGNSLRWNREYSEEFMKAADAKLVKLGLNEPYTHPISGEEFTTGVLLRVFWVRVKQESQSGDRKVY